jgi:hypothetical protein
LNMETFIVILLRRVMEAHGLRVFLSDLSTIVPPNAVDNLAVAARLRYP